MKTIDTVCRPQAAPKPTREVQLEEKLLRGIYEKKPELVVEALNGLFPALVFTMMSRPGT